MPSRKEKLYKLSVNVPTADRLKQAKKDYGQRSFEALFNHLLDTLESENCGGKDAK
jgi:hypothetical protein